MKATDLLYEFYDATADAIDYSQTDDTRRPRLTFKHLQNLRKAKDIAHVDNAEHTLFLPSMYDTSEDSNTI